MKNVCAHILYLQLTYYLEILHANKNMALIRLFNKIYKKKRNGTVVEMGTVLNTLSAMACCTEPL